MKQLEARKVIPNDKSNTRKFEKCCNGLYVVSKVFFSNGITYEIIDYSYTIKKKYKFHKKKYFGNEKLNEIVKEYESQLEISGNLSNDTQEQVAVHMCGFDGVQREGGVLVWRLCSMSFESGVMPVDWRSDVIVLLYKGNGERTECRNYRGISVV